jgi:hypothetical protein
MSRRGGAAGWGVGERGHGNYDARRLFRLNDVLVVLNACKQFHADASFDDNARDLSTDDELDFIAVDYVDMVQNGVCADQDRRRVVNAQGFYTTVYYHMTPLPSRSRALIHKDIFIVNAIDRALVGIIVYLSLNLRRVFISQK